MSQEAMKLALEALENTLGFTGSRQIDSVTRQTITSLRQAIAEAEKQERNFCPRCGKRTNDIHTCTPPRDNT